MNILHQFHYCPICGESQFVANSPKSLKCNNCNFEYFLNASAAVVAFIFNSKNELLVERRKFEPAKGTLDLPGGFIDMSETGEEGIAREVKEETGLTVQKSKYLFSLPNTYRYSGVDIPTLDLFFLCEVNDEHSLQAADDAAECIWIAVDKLQPELFGLGSVREGLLHFIHHLAEYTR